MIDLCNPREPANTWSHLIGVILSLLGSIMLVYKGAVLGSCRHVVSFVIYGGSLVSLYLASTIYHSLRVAEGWLRVLRQIDHSMIFVLIAGSYTPLCLIALRGAWRWGLIAGVWGFTTLGVTLKIFWLDAPRWLSTALYLLMGWLAVVAFGPLATAITWKGVGWLLAGGILYSIGAVMYGARWPRLRSRSFGFHELFHLFVLGGSAVHFWVMARFVMPLP